MVTAYIYPSIGSQCTLMAEKKPVQVIGKKSSETANCIEIIGKNSLSFQWSQVFNQKF